jgi:hypothetical protein
MRPRVKVQETIEEKPENTEKPACHHFWVIEVANGPSSFGRCKYCGEKKEFLNAFPTYHPLKKNLNPIRLPKLLNVEIAKDSES